MLYNNISVRIAVVLPLDQKEAKRGLRTHGIAGSLKYISYESRNGMEDRCIKEEKIVT